MSLTVTKSGIEVERVAGSASADWNSLVERSPHASVFHRRGLLEVVADRANADLHCLVGYKGQEPVGLFPVFEVTRNFVTAVFSPPPGVEVPHLGPAMLGLENAKRRRAEKRTHRFVEGCLEWVEQVLDPSYSHVRPSPQYVDNRPFDWNGFDLRSRFTYIVDLRPGPEEVLSSFSSDARRNVRSTDEDAYTIEKGQTDAIDKILDHLSRRHDDQGMTYSLDASFFHDVAAALPEDCFHVYLCRVDGEYASGMFALDDGRTVYRWQGGARPLSDASVPINDLLDWRIMTDAMDSDREAYDLVGANTKALCEYKSKFGPELVPYAEIERGTRTMRFISDLYRKFR